MANYEVTRETLHNLNRIREHATKAQRALARACRNPFMLPAASATQLVAVERAMSDLARAIEVADIQLTSDCALLAVSEPIEDRVGAL
jgi:hypothetical protein